MKSFDIVAIRISRTIYSFHRLYWHFNRMSLDYHLLTLGLNLI